jgi:hypothetical protein
MTVFCLDRDLDADTTTDVLQSLVEIDAPRSRRKHNEIDRKERMMIRVGLLVFIFTTVVIWSQKVAKMRNR